MSVSMHTHTDASCSDSVISARKIGQLAAERGVSHVAVTDHGSISGLYKAWQSCSDAGVSLIPGCELYLCPNDDASAYTGKRYHLTVLGNGVEGYKELCSLVTTSHLTNGRVVRKRMAQKNSVENLCGNNNIVVLTGCIGGLFFKHYTESRNDGKRFLKRLGDIVGKDRVFIEVMLNGTMAESTVDDLLSLSGETNIPAIVSFDSHYPDPIDKQIYAVVKSSGGMSVDSGFDLSLISNARWEQYRKIYPQLIENTETLAGMFSPFSFEAIKADPVKFYEEQSREIEELKHKTLAGLKKRYPNKQEYQRSKIRAARELELIIELGFSGYFLIIEDMIRYAKNNGIPVGMGRGSAAGSIICYALGITDICPMKHRLMFSRFLHRGRVSPPDIDMDYCAEKKYLIIEYLVKKYGTAYPLLMWQRMALKSAFKDSARFCGVPFPVANEVTNILPNSVDEIPDFRNSLDYSKIRDKYTTVDLALDYATKLSGTCRQTGKHPAGVVVCPKKPDIAPIIWDKNGESQVLGYDMYDSESMGFLKLDVLGLSTLTVLDETLRESKDTSDRSLFKDSQVALEHILLPQRTLGIFQFSSHGMAKAIETFKPDSFDDICLLNAAFRPGPLQFIKDMARVKQGEEPEIKPPAVLEPFLKRTYMFPVYQEQVIAILRKIGGFTPEEADSVRKGIGKKKAELVLSAREKFVANAQAISGLSEEEATTVFDWIEQFAGYGFNACLTGDTLLLCHDGTHKSIDEIHIDMLNCKSTELVSYAGEESGLSNKCVDIIDTGVQDVFLVTLSDGSTIQCTEEHRFLCADNEYHTIKEIFDLGLDMLSDMEA